MTLPWFVYRASTPQDATPCLGSIRTACEPWLLAIRRQCCHKLAAGANARDGPTP